MKNPKNCFVIVRYQCWWWKHFFAIRRKLHLWLILFLNSYYYPVTIQSDTTLTYIILLSLWANQISHLKVFALGKIWLFYPLLSSLSYATTSSSSTMTVLANIFSIAAATQVSAVEICFTTLASVGRTSLCRTATFYQLDYSLRSWRQSSHHRKPFVVLQLPAKVVWWW